MTDTTKAASVVAGVAAVVGAGVDEARRAVASALGSGRRQGAPSPWRTVTVNRAPQDVAPDGRLPAPLQELGDAVEVEVRPAPGGRGTELAARLREGDPSGVAGAAARLTGDDPRQDVRGALREAKQLLETGYVLHADEPGTSKRTLTNLPLELATRRARKEGRL